MQSINRRSLLGAGLAISAVAVTGSPAIAGQKVSKNTKGAIIGDLTSIVDNGQLALPAGFTAQRVGTIGVEALLDDRNGAKVGVTPSNLDGTGCFQVGNVTRLVRNHECRAKRLGPGSAR